MTADARAFPPPYTLHRVEGFAQTHPHERPRALRYPAMVKAKTPAAAMKALRTFAKESAAGLYWIADARGVPFYGLNAYDAQKAVRVPMYRCQDRDCPERFAPTTREGGNCPECGKPREEGGHSTDYPKGETMRVLKGGNMPWGR